jgi:DNA mismatch repair protein MutS
MNKVKKHIEYLKLQKQAEEEHGPKTLVLYHMGMFYEIYCYNVAHCETEEEMYDYDNIKWEVSVGDAAAIKKILNCRRGSKNNEKPHSVKNPYLLGFPTTAYDQNLETLLSNGYKVIRYDQYKVGQPSKSSKKIEYDRVIGDICDPTTHIDFIPQDVSNSYIVSVYIEYKDIKDIPIKFQPSLCNASVGVALLDALSGKSKVCEFYSKKSDPSVYVQQLYSFILSHKPKELVVNISNIPNNIADIFAKYIKDSLELDRYERVIMNINKISKEYNKISYQTECFNKLFSKITVTNDNKSKAIQKKNNDIIRHFGLDMMNFGLIAYILLMERCNNNCPGILDKLDPPNTKWIDESCRLVLTYNSLIQLNVISSDKTESVKVNKENSKVTSLLSLLDQNITNLGKNLLYDIIQSPMVDPVEITTYYDMIDESRNITINGKPLWKVLEIKLRELPDMDRLNRKLMIKKISPKELASLIKGYRITHELLEIILSTKAKVFKQNILCPEEFTILTKLTDYLNKTVNHESLSKCSILRCDSDLSLNFVDNPFCEGINTDIDESFRGLSNRYDQLDDIVDHFNSFLTRGGLKTPELGKGKKKTDGYQIKILATNAKAKTILASAYNKTICGKLTTNTHSTTEKEITSELIENITKDIVDFGAQLMDDLYTQYISLVVDIINFPLQVTSFYTKINDVIAKIDLIHNYAKLATKYNYSRPKINNNNLNNTSFIKLTELRHPIIERIIDGPYITNNLTINQSGLLIYGHNRVGKSSIILATGLNLLMAQAGCYVPCTEMEYFPYNKIFTRMASGDSILQGKSSFDVEMSELGMILKQADDRSLVLANELACSTETLSASAISASAIVSFNNLKCGYMLASHAHNLIELSRIKQIPPNKLRICHLAVNKDISTGCLVYNRKLIDGLGSRVYGVHVAESLSLESEFIKTAYEILNELEGKNDNLSSTKISN